MFFVNSRIFFKIIWFLYDNDPRHERVKCNRYTDNSNDFYFFYLDVNRLMITNNCREISKPRRESRIKTS